MRHVPATQTVPLPEIAALPHGAKVHVEKRVATSSYAADRGTVLPAAERSACH